MDSSRAPPAAERADTKTARLEHPSGILYLFQHESVPLLVDALLDLPPQREFNKSELANYAGVTRQTVSRYVDVLIEVDLIEHVPNTSPPRYRLAESETVQEIFELNSALNASASEMA